MSTLIIHGDRPTKRFTKTPNELINDADLSGLAIAIATFIISKPEGWKTDLKALYRRFCRDSKYAIKKAVKELQDCGILSIEFIKQGRRFTECVWHFMLDIVSNPLDSVPRNPQGQHTEGENTQERHRYTKTNPSNTDLNKTVSNKESAPSALPESKGVSNRFKDMVDRLSKRAAPAELMEQRLKQEQELSRIQREAEFERLGPWGYKFKDSSPEDTVNGLYSHFLAANKNRMLDNGNIHLLIEWYRKNNDITKLIEAFELTQKNSKTLSAKYTLGILS